MFHLLRDVLGPPWVSLGILMIIELWYIWDTMFCRALISVNFKISFLHPMLEEFILNL